MACADQAFACLFKQLPSGERRRSNNLSYEAFNHEESKQRRDQKDVNQMRLRKDVSAADKPCSYLSK